MSILLGLFIGLVVIEIFFSVLVNYIRGKNPWFITGKDLRISYNENDLSNFIRDKFDSELGWDKHKNSKGVEKSVNGVTEWKINKNGARNNFQFNSKSREIAVFGDSFAFGRGVNDDETWTHQLSIQRNTNVENYAVEGYGFDQALVKLGLKLATGTFKPQKVIIAVSPSTILKIHSVWKHYVDYGKIYEFKPRFKLEEDGISFIANRIDSKEKFFRINEYIRHLEWDDYFFKNQFLKEVITFPYTYKFIKNLERNLSMVFETFKKKNITAPTYYIRRKKLKQRIHFYHSREREKLLSEELKLFADYGKKFNFEPFFLMIPQKDDVTFMNQYWQYYYQGIFKRMNEGIHGIDFYDTLKFFSSIELKDYYIEKNSYGGYLSPKGHELLADVISQSLVLFDNKGNSGESDGDDKQEYDE